MGGGAGCGDGSGERIVDLMNALEGGGTCPPTDDLCTALFPTGAVIKAGLDGEPC